VPRPSFLVQPGDQTVMTAPERQQEREVPDYVPILDSMPEPAPWSTVEAVSRRLSRPDQARLKGGSGFRFGETLGTVVRIRG
jgi:hypothetical protein